MNTAATAVTRDVRELMQGIGRAAVGAAQALARAPSALK